MLRNSHRKTDGTTKTLEEDYKFHEKQLLKHGTCDETKQGNENKEPATNESQQLAKNDHEELISVSDSRDETYYQRAIFLLVLSFLMYIYIF